jgi:hypothetical protein
MKEKKLQTRNKINALKMWQDSTINERHKSVISKKKLIADEILGLFVQFIKVPLFLSDNQI